VDNPPEIPAGSERKHRMAFDQPTRNRLARFVGEARSLLAEEFTRQLQHEYGLDPTSGEITALEKLTALDDARRETARILRETVSYYCSTASTQQSLERIVREQAFTVLNRLCALRMAEARGLILEAVAQGYRSKGFQLYARLAGSALGETGQAYRSFLFSLFDELALELPPLFDRFSPQGRLFPRESALLKLLDLLNAQDMDALWAEDETIGWIYQYFNSKEERQKMRAESQAPRNSRELAVRNQFFTPRYVVEFLTDNTLGRIWYEMTRGETALKEFCRYLVRRPCEVFLGYPTFDYDRLAPAWVGAVLDQGNFTMLPADPSLDDLGWLARLIDAETIAAAQGYGDLKLLSERCVADLRTGKAPPSDPLALWLILFAFHTGLVGYGFDTISETSDPIRPYAYRVYAALRQALLEPHTDLSQEELLRQPVFIPHRPLKDPRDILMLDPACGSMHFGLYAFDLYEKVYAEAWEIEEQGGLGRFLRSPGLRPLHETYPDREAFWRDVPRLIIEHNLHGIDIDPRAVQIAGLSLWLRAQKSWQAQGLKPQERPQIRKSNIVCAEPMPGDREMLEEFLAGLRAEKMEELMRRALDLPAGRQVRATPQMDDALAGLVRTVWQEMELAGEAGSLLKIEETLRDAIITARQQAEEKSPLFRVLEFGLNEPPKEQVFQVLAGEERDFWNQAETLALAALRAYAEQAENGGGYRRRLFVEDAGQGFAFIDLCRKRYDVVLMNPPFGEAADRSLVCLDSAYHTWNKNILCSFIERGWDMTFPSGSVGAIYDRTAIVKSSYEGFRRVVLTPDNRLIAMADLGWGVLDANVEVTTSVLQHLSVVNGGFIDSREITVNEKDVFIQTTIRDLPDRKPIFEYGISFQKLPNAVIGYDFPDFLRRAFVHEKSLEESGYKANQGFALKAEKHFRVWWELPLGKTGVVNRMFNGAGFQPYNASLYDVTISNVEPEDLPMDSSTRKSGLGNHRKPGICFGKRGDYFCAHVLPSGHIFTVEGQSIPVNNPEKALEVLGLLNTPLIRLSLNKYCGQHKYSGYVNLLPYIPFKESKQCVKIVKHTITAIQEAQAFDELQMLFHPNKLGHSIAECAFNLNTVINNAWEYIEICESFCNEQAIDAYKVGEKERVLLYDFKRRQPKPIPAIEDADVDTHCRWLASHTVISFSLGILFARWDVRRVIGEKPAPNTHDPFAPLPACPPGMLQNAQGLPAAAQDVPADYPLRITWGGVLVDDPGHPEDVSGRVRQALQVIWNERAEAIEQEACQILGVRSLEEYFQKPVLFFAEHLKRYSKSRRQAPIYWPLSTPSGSYTLWLYYHRLSDQILFTCVNDFIDPRLKQVADDLARLRRKSGRSAADEKELERLTDLERELKDLRAELLRVAAFWKPNLNDGVEITAAPLWKLFQHKPWQKRLKVTWGKLEGGEYDWAHLAYSIWPERVRAKCKMDKSLAIAHGLEELYVEVKGAGKRKGKGKEVEQEEMEL